MIPPARNCGRRLRRLVRPCVARAAAVPGADRDRKHFPAHAHLEILLDHVLDGSDSLRQTHARLDGQPGAWAALDLAAGISRSQLARSSTSRSPACAERLWQEVLLRARAVRPDPEWQALTAVQVVDSTFLARSAALSPWSHYGRHAAGVRVQCGYDLADAIPTHLGPTLADTHDARALKERDLAPLAGWTILIDLGDYGHKQFVRLRAAAVSVICPLHAQAAYRVTAAQPVDPTPTPDGDVVLTDETITPGSPNNRNGAVLDALRLVTSQNQHGTPHRFVTDRTDRTAAEVVRLYRTRWHIERFFRWLKHALKTLTPLGTSPQAVWLTVLLAAIAAVLLMVAETDRPIAVSRIAWLRTVAQAFAPTALTSS